MAGPEGPYGDDLFYWLALSMAPGVGARRFARLVQAFGTPRQVFGAPAADLERVGRLSSQAARTLRELGWGKAVEREIALAARSGLSLLTLNDPGYPARLKEIHGPPPVLWVAGDLKPEDQARVAVVGTRSPSDHGRTMAARLGKDLAAAGITVVSGVALGIDAAAQAGAMEAGGRTIGVLGCGVNVVYPRTNRYLYEKIPGQGALVSEFPLNTQPRPGHFPQRNRIIAGLSLAVVVVEAAEKSGALITARMALDENRDVMAVPGRPGTPLASGVNHLIRQGAVLVESARDIITEILPQLGPGQTVPRERPAKPSLPMAPAALPLVPPDLTEDQRRVFGALVEEAVHVDQVGRTLGLPPQRLGVLLVELELLGLVKELPGKRYTRI